jgi:hypothetical protein
VGVGDIHNGFKLLFLVSGMEALGIYFISTSKIILMFPDFSFRHDIPNSKQPKIFKISESKNHMAVLHGRRANNYFPHTKEVSPAAGNQRPFASGRLLDQLKKNRQRPLILVSAPVG